MPKAPAAAVWIDKATDARRERDALIQALTPFVEAYRKSIDPGTADLYGEQPRHVTVTLGDCRHADMCLSRVTKKEQPQ